MKSPTLASLKVLCFLLIAAGCAAPHTTVDSRRAKVPNFSLSSVRVEPQAYHAPDAKWTSDVQGEVLKYTGGGLIPALIGAAIDRRVLAEQQKRFEDSQATLLPTLNDRASKPPAPAVEAAVTSAVKGNKFLAQKIRADAKDILEIKIVRFGLAKRNKEEDADPRMVAQILVDLTIRSSNDAVIRLGGYAGSSNDSLPISALLKDPGAIERLYDEAAESLRAVVLGFFSRKYDE